MANYSPNTTTDMNLTGNVQGTDLDITWAHLQVKALLEASSDGKTITIDSTEFKVIDTITLRSAVRKMYEINRSASVAEPTQGAVYNLPENIGSESYAKLWRMNEIFDAGKFGRQPTPSQPSALYESIEGEQTGTILGSYRWSRKGQTDPYLTLFAGASVELNDNREVGGDMFPYCISFSMYIGSALADGKLFTKGNFYVEVKNNKIFLKRTDLSNSQATGISFTLPNGMTADGLKNRWTDVRVMAVKTPNITTGASVADYKVFIDDVECELVSKLFSDTIRSADETQPITFKCNPIESLKNVRISHDTASYPLNSESFQYDFSLDTDTSFNYRAFENEIIDTAGNKMEVTGFPGVNSQHKTWVAKDGSGGPSVTNVAKVSNNRYITAPNVDISKNFTISFWFKAISSTDNVVLFDSVDGGKYFRAFFTSEDLKIQLPNKTYTVSSSVTYTEWTHFVLVKNGEGMGVYLNGVLAFSSDITNKMSTVTLMDLNFGAIAKNKTVYHLSSLKIMKYAITHIGVSGWDGIPVDNKIERLLNNNF